MGKYFNNTRTTLSATDSKGQVVCFPPKSWADVANDVESSASIVRYVKKGFLQRVSEATTPEITVPAVVATSVVVLVPDAPIVSVSKPKNKDRDKDKVLSSEASASVVGSETNR